MIVISDAMAKRFWPNADPIGKRLTIGFFPEKPREVVGIVGDVKLEGLERLEPVSAMYVPSSQIPTYGMEFAIRSRTPGVVVAAVAAVHEVDPSQPVLEVGSMEQFIASSLSRQRLAMLLLAGFAALALVLARSDLQRSTPTPSGVAPRDRNPHGPGRPARGCPATDRDAGRRPGAATHSTIKIMPIKSVL